MRQLIKLVFLEVEGLIHEKDVHFWIEDRSRNSPEKCDMSYEISVCHAHWQVWDRILVTARQFVKPVLDWLRVLFRFPEALIYLFEYKLEVVVEFCFGLNHKSNRYVYDFLNFPAEGGPLLVNEFLRDLRGVEVVHLDHTVVHEGLSHSVWLFERALSDVLRHVAGKPVALIIIIFVAHLRKLLVIIDVAFSGSGLLTL